MLPPDPFAHWIPLAGIALAFLSTLSVLAFWRGRLARAGPRGERELGRSPGQALRDALSQAGLDAAEYAALSLFLLPLAASAYAAWWAADGVMPGSDATLFVAAAALSLQLWVLWRLSASLRRSRRLRYGYEAELVAGQELNGLGGLGYHVFHDVPLGGRAAKVDHVLVGPAGVFAVETEARARRGAQAEREVTYDGASLCFAERRETAPLERAVELAGRVGEWLAAEVGEQLAVQPVVVLPGWRVRRTDVSGIPVLAASRIRYYFGRLRPRAGMSEALIERVAQCVELRCRGTAQAGQ
ncbi:MAG TPA: nuclease-related domain-containing protein [Burkholderiales bacterium]|nr:nuclease-related domain-containing protein [Burkholderiales bacterium]